MEIIFRLSEKMHWLGNQTNTNTRDKVKLITGAGQRRQLSTSMAPHHPVLDRVAKLHKFNVNLLKDIYSVLSQLATFQRKSANSTKITWMGEFT